MSSILNEPIQILILAPEDAVDILVKTIPSSWNIKVANTIDECKAKLDLKSAALLIYDKMIKERPVEILDEFRNYSPLTRLVLFRFVLSMDETISLFNKEKINRMIDLESKHSEPKEILQSAVEDYLKLTASARQEEIIENRLNFPHSELISEDRLLDLALQLSDSKEIEDFSNQFVSMIEGIQSFISINYSVYQDSKDKTYEETIFGYFSDLELLANQYDQKILLIYIEISRAYLYLEFDKLEEAMNHYKNGVRIFYWISTEYIDKEIVNIINSFPIMEDEYYYIQTGEKSFEMDLKERLNLRNNINILLNYDISKLTNLSETFYKNLKIKTNIIQSLMVVKDSLPLYVFEHDEEVLDPALVSGFVQALSTFLQELVAGKGDIDHITHDKGVILIHREDDIKYLLVSSTDEIYLRMGLRQFAKETSDQFEDLPPNEEASPEQYKEYNEMINELFRLQDE